MSIKTEFQDVVSYIRRRGWTSEHFNQLLRIVYECYTIDEVFSDTEKKAFERKLKNHQLDIETIKSIDFQQSMADLSADISKKRILYHAIADALFTDEDYDTVESDFVNRIIQKFELDGVYLRTIIKEVRDAHIDKAIRKWYKEEVK